MLESFLIKCVCIQGCFYYVISNKLESKIQFNFRKQWQRVNLIGTYCSRDALCQPADLEQSQPSESSRGENERQREAKNEEEGEESTEKEADKRGKFLSDFAVMRERSSALWEKDTRETLSWLCIKQKTMHTAQVQDAIQLTQSQRKDVSNFSGGIASSRQ